MAHVGLAWNADETITVRIGRYIESVSTDKSPVELLDAVRYAALAGGASVEEDWLWEQIQTLRRERDA